MFKVQELRGLIRLIDQSSISEFTYENDGSTMTIKKETKQSVVNQVEEVVQQAVPVQTQAVVEEKKEEVVLKEIPKQQAVPAQTEDDDSIIEIDSPMVGTFYRKPSPESDAYVEVGSTINDETIVCIVEAMKLFNEIEAETSGEIVEILVGDGELVEYGQPLFKVKTK